MEDEDVFLSSNALSDKPHQVAKSLKRKSDNTAEVKTVVRTTRVEDSNARIISQHVSRTMVSIPPALSPARSLIVARGADSWQNWDDDHLP